MEKIVKIRSSSGEGTYEVKFKFESDLISVNCNCQAGLVKTLCKHRINLIEGDPSATIDEEDQANLSEILKLFDKTKFSNLFTELNSTEKEIKRLDTLKKKLRKEIGLKISNGF